MSRICACLVIAAMAIAVPVTAGENGFYVGGGLAKSTIEVKGFYPDLENQRGQENNFGFKLFGGYRFLEFLAAEASYVDVGSQETWETATLRWEERANVGVTGWTASAVGMLPLGTVDLIARVGMFSWDSNVTLKSVYGDRDDSASGTDVTYGAGIGFNFEHLIARGEVEWFKPGDADSIIMVSVSLAYRF